MVRWGSRFILLLVAFGLLGIPALAQGVGSIRGVVTDKDFDVPLSGASVTIAENNVKVATADQGNFVFKEVAPGRYTLVFSKDGYQRQVKADVVVTAGQLTDVDVALAGEFTEMDEFVVQDVQVGAGSEAALLKLRFESPALLDSIGADMMQRAGASDAAAALRLVAGVSLSDGKSAVIRGLPDRYVSSQLNHVRLPTADSDKRAVELDQFPAAAIESIQVSKTFTPDQQGDASGGAVDVLLKGVPTDPIYFKFSSQYSFNSQVVAAGGDFLTYDGGGVDFWGRDQGGRDIQWGNLGSNWDGAVGVTRGDAPLDYKWSMALGGNHDLCDGVKIGGALQFFYERDSRFFDNGINDSYWVTSPGAAMTPRTGQGVPDPAGGGDFKTALFDVTQAAQQVQWGALGTFGLQTEHNSVNFTYLYTRTTTDTATLAEDTRGKAYFFPGYDPDDPTTPGHDAPGAAPYLRLETLNYVERTTQTVQFNGHHEIPIGECKINECFKFLNPEIEWLAAWSAATLFQPDKRQFGELWYPGQTVGGVPIPPVHLPYKPASNFTLGNVQRIWQRIEEDSEQYALNLKFPFEQWSGDKGYLKLGAFNDEVDRLFKQETFSNFNDNAAFFYGDFDQHWSNAFPDENHAITEALTDVNYRGKQKITAFYAMLDMPISKALRSIGGVRFESTEIGIVNDPEAEAMWFPPGSVAPTTLNPGDADVDFSQADVLPSFALEYKPCKKVTLRGAFNETIARPTFKELTPIIQQEFLGGPIFIGNPEIQMSSIKNYDLRVDYAPYDGALVSASWFAKDIKLPIEYVQRVAASFDYTTAVNYPEGSLSGFEVEVRQDLGHFWEPLQGLSVGGNATFINSEVTLPDDEAAAFNLPNILAPMTTRDMTNAPEYLYNLFLTYDIACTGTHFGIFYTVQGDTLLAGAAQSMGNFVPSIYATEFGTLNATVTQDIGEHFKLQFQAKNLTNPAIETVYRSKYIGDDVRHTSFTRGMDFSITLSAEFRF